ncbi:Sperm-tail PG-rich repeat-containing protein 2 [Manis javanica]|nr:Sperm-tail PG-rich repeat-containing protein 2 [Manis javanica]
MGPKGCLVVLSPRFVPIKSITPAPGTYNESRTAFKSLKKTLGLKNAPFGQSAARFKQYAKTEEMPGPGKKLLLLLGLLIIRLVEFLMRYLP